jgi:hypothetical protein
VVMPGKLDGYDLALMVMERWPTTRVVLTSGFPGSNGRRERAASVPLLTKPYRRDDLARILRQVLDARP